MNDEQARCWMKQLAAGTPASAIPAAERLWMRARLEAEFEERRRLRAPLLWIEVAAHGAIALALAVAAAGIMGR